MHSYHQVSWLVGGGVLIVVEGFRIIFPNCQEIHDLALQVRDIWEEIGLHNKDWRTYVPPKPHKIKKKSINK